MKIVNKRNDVIIRFTIDNVTYNVKLDNGVNDISGYPIQVKKFLKSYLCNIKDDRYVIYLSKYDSMNFTCEKSLGKEGCECVKNDLIVLNENDITQGELLANKVSSNPNDVKMREFNKNLIKIIKDEISRIDDYKSRHLQSVNIPAQEIDEEKKDQMRRTYDLFHVLLDRRKEFLLNRLKELEAESDKEDVIEEQNIQYKKKGRKNNNTENNSDTESN